MTTFQELDAYLSQKFSTDYWYNNASLYACELVKQLTTENWNAIHASWRNRSKQWQERCAEILDWGEARQAVPLLLEMIEVEDDELTLTAADSLSSIGVAELDLPVRGCDLPFRISYIRRICFSCHFLYATVSHLLYLRRKRSPSSANFTFLERQPLIVLLVLF